jgi:hypothetical protein
MNPFHRQARLFCTTLEDRTTPAVTAALNGGALVLTGDNTDNDVQIIAGIGNMVDVNVNGNPAGSFHPTTGIFATMGTGNDKVDLFLHGNTLTVANVVLRGGDGKDQLSVDGGILQGSAWLIGGNGDDSIGIGGATVSGATAVLDGGAGNDTGFFSAGLTNGWALGVQSMALGGSNITGNFVDLPGEVLPASLSLDGTVVAGSASYFGTSAADTVRLGSGSKVTGNFTAALGEGNNTFTMDPSATTLGRTQVFAGSGNDTFSFGSGAATANMDLVLGNGTNTVTFSGAAVTGNLRIWGGSGSDTFSANAHDSVTGNLSLYLGDGANTYNGMQNNVGGTFTYFGGSGVDTVNISGARDTSYAIVMRLGAGDDTFTYTHVTGTSLDPKSFNIDFGSGTNTFNHNVPITWPSTVVGV